MGEIKTFRDLQAWQVGMETTMRTYELTSTFPEEERYGLVSQMRRASISIPSNVAEGDGVDRPRWALRYINTAIASSLELETQLEIAVKLQYASRERAHKLADSLDRAQKLLYGMRRSKRQRIGLAASGAGIVLLVSAGLFT